MNLSGIWLIFPLFHGNWEDIGSIFRFKSSSHVLDLLKKLGKKLTYFPIWWFDGDESHGLKKQNTQTKNTTPSTIINDSTPHLIDIDIVRRIHFWTGIYIYTYIYIHYIYTLIQRISPWNSTKFMDRYSKFLHQAYGIRHSTMDPLDPPKCETPGTLASTATALMVSNIQSTTWESTMDHKAGHFRGCVRG